MKCAKLGFSNATFWKYHWPGFVILKVGTNYASFNFSISNIFNIYYIYIDIKIKVIYIKYLT